MLFRSTGKLIRQYIPEYATNNAHMYYIILPTEEKRSEVITYLKQNEIMAPFHYIPLHLSPMGQRFGYKQGDLPITEEYSNRLLRLPLYADLTNEDQEKVIKCLKKVL